MTEITQAHTSGCTCRWTVFGCVNWYANLRNQTLVLAIKTWPKLPKPIRTGILAMVKAVKPLADKVSVPDPRAHFEREHHLASVEKVQVTAFVLAGTVGNLLRHLGEILATLEALLNCLDLLQRFGLFFGRGCFIDFYEDVAGRIISGVLNISGLPS